MTSGRAIIIFIRNDPKFVVDFFVRHHPRIPAPYVLVAGTTDHCMFPPNVLRSLDDPKVRRHPHPLRHFPARGDRLARACRPTL
eukprot:scaffold115204_cov33-Tisochrysis_lutea.AAC.2